MVASDPGAFPLEWAEIVVVFGKTLPDVDPLGYQPEHAIIEVLADVGAVVEPEGWSTRSSQDPAADFYVVTFETESPGRLIPVVCPVLWFRSVLPLPDQEETWIWVAHLSTRSSSWRWGRS